MKIKGGSVKCLLLSWIPPAGAGWVAAEFLKRSSKRARARLTVIALATFVVAYAAAWFSAAGEQLVGGSGEE